MAYLDPHGGPRGWERQDGPRGSAQEDGPRWDGRDGDTGTPVRAWHDGAAPDAYTWPGGHSPNQVRNDHLHAPGYRDRAASGDRYPGEYGQRPPSYPPSTPYAPSGGFPGADPNAEADTATLPRVDAEPARPPGRVRGRRRAGRRRAGSGRAGRNLPAAIGVGLALAVLILAPLFLFRPAFFVVVAAAVGVGSWELGRAVGARGAHPPLVPLIAGGLLMTGLAWRAGPDGLSLGLLVTVLAAVVWRLADGPAGYQRDVVAATLISVYVPFLAGFAVLLAVPGDGDWRVLVTLAAVVLSDTGGYAVGVIFGKHPMAPSVSPKKSWEGFAGSVGSAAIGGALILAVTLDVELWWGALFGLAIAVAAVLGDLCESMIKRDLGVKDMSNLLPGHGGLMDRLDSVLFAVPTAYLLLSVIAPPA